MAYTTYFGGEFMGNIDEVKELFTQLNEGNQEYVLAILQALKRGQDSTSKEQADTGLSGEQTDGKNRKGSM